jgi:hypothetical protein
MKMKRTNIKDGFGGEVPFTKFIANDLETSRRLLTALDLSYEDGYSVTPEEHTAHSKRVDLVIRDVDQDVVLVVESQDASGWLDAVHASKVTYYMYDKKCDDGVLICEDADEHIKGFVKWLNDNTPLRITLVSVMIFEAKPNPHCEFTCLIRPSDLRDKKVRRVTANATSDTSVSDRTQELYDAYPDLFTNVARDYVSKTNVGGSGMTVAIHPYKTEGYWVEVWHAGKHDTDGFKQSFTEAVESAGYEAGFQARRGYVKVSNTKTAIEAFNLLVSALESKKIHG